MRVFEIVLDDSADVAPFLDGFVIRRSRSKTSFLAGDRNRYSGDLNPVMKQLLSRGVSDTAKIWLGDPKQKEGELLGTIQSILNRKFPPPFLKLFHGTSSDRLPSILKHGLVPVGKADRVWNTGEDITARGDAIYLTAVKAQAEYYAMKAVDKVETAKPVILEIIIPQSLYGRLVPDDDYLDDKHKKKDNWQTSLSYYGQIAFVGAIPKDRIRVIARGIGAVQQSQ